MNFQNIEIGKVFPDLTNFRTSINPDLMGELVESVKTRGILEPLLVRPVGDGFVIIAGERRWIAAEKAGLTELPCIIKDVSEEEAKQIQLDENVHREDLTPMDEARMYLFFLETIRKTKITDIADLSLVTQEELTQISAIVHKDKKFIQSRIKLNCLIPEYQKDIEEGFLPVSHGYILCAYDHATQIKAKDVMYDSKFIRKSDDRDSEEWQEGEYVHAREYGLRKTAKELSQHLEWRETSDLTEAIFPTDSTKFLRFDGTATACTNCEFRTGANIGLFAESETDHCLNVPCFKNKTTQYVQIQRTKAQDDYEQEVLIISTEWSEDSREGFITRNSCRVLKFDNEDPERNSKICFLIRKAIDEKTGGVIDVCLESSACPVHYPNASQKSADAEPTAEDKAKKRAERNEELWNAKVADVVRLRVIAEASRVFADRYTEHSAMLQPFFARIWQNLAYNANKHIKELCEMAKIGMPGTIENGDYEFTLAKLPTKQQLILGFCLTHYWKGDCSYTKSLVSQYPIVAIAEEFDVNYELIDAQVRLEIGKEKHAKLHKIYLHSVENNLEEREIPRLFTQTEEKPVTEAKNKPSKAKKDIVAEPIVEKSLIQSIKEESLQIDPISIEEVETSKSDLEEIRLLAVNEPTNQNNLRYATELQKSAKLQMHYQNQQELTAKEVQSIQPTITEEQREIADFEFWVLQHKGLQIVDAKEQIEKESTLYQEFYLDTKVETEEDSYYETAPYEVEGVGQIVTESDFEISNANDEIEETEEGWKDPRTKFTFEVPLAKLKEFGDANQCYSIMDKKKILKTVKFNGKEYACTGSSHGFATCYEVIDADTYEGDTITYAELNSVRGYEGMKMGSKKGNIVLTNRTEFIPEKELIEEDATPVEDLSGEFSEERLEELAEEFLEATEIVEPQEVSAMEEKLEEIAEETEPEITEKETMPKIVEFAVSQERLKSFADTIQCEQIQKNNKVTQSFEFFERQYACISVLTSGFGIRNIQAYRLIPIEEFTGKTFTYKSNQRDGYLHTKVLYSGNNPELNGREFVLDKRAVLSDLSVENQFQLAMQKLNERNAPSEPVETIETIETIPEEVAETLKEIVDNFPGDDSERFNCLQCGTETTFNQSPDGIVCPSCDDFEAETIEAPSNDLSSFFR